MASYKITADQAGTRLDVFAQTKKPTLSRSIMQKLCQAGQITVNGKPKKASYKIKANDKIAINYQVKPPKTTAEINIPIIYEDVDVTVINKPAGVLSHSKGGLNPEDTVATWLRRQLNFQKGWGLNEPASKNNRLGIVHRLDRATSGVMVGANNPFSMKYLQKQFADRKVAKHYVALVKGTPKITEAKIDVPIERNPKKPATFRAGINGKPAITVYKVLKTINKISLVELTPQTGRTHQLRVHMLHLGHPIIGDTLYKGDKANRLMLHAWKLDIRLSSSSLKHFEAPLPSEFKSFINK